MRKKIILISALAIIIALLSMFLVACNDKTGAPGKSAYELAIEQGFKGTLDEWLESLKGVDGVDGKDGTNGTNGKDGIDGKDGLDGAVTIQEIYDKAVEEGYSGTYIDFLQSYLDLSEDVQAAAHIALLSAVKVRAQGSISYWGSKRDVTSSGSGVIYRLNKESGSAYIITNYHVVYNKNYITTLGDGISENIDVFLYGYDELENQSIHAKYIAGAKDYDIAILYVQDSDIIKKSSARAVDVMSSKDVALGSTAIAVGAPSSGDENSYNELKFAITKGIVSVDSEDLSLNETSIGLSYTTRVMRVDTPINSGNSGGGLFNARGQLIGIVNAKSTSTNIDNMGYAIPSDVAVGIAEYAIAHCDGDNNKNIKKLYLGIGGAINSSKAVYDSATKTVKVVEIVIGEIVNGALAYESGLQVGDILKSVEFDGVKYEITRDFSLPDILWKVKSSTSKLKFYITRGAADLTVELSISADNFNTLK